jgi:alanyl aminopeptidase
MLPALVLAALLLASAPARSEEPSRDGVSTGLRLGRDVVPLRERVALAIDPRDSTYAGRVEIELRVVRETPGFRFHAQDMTLAAATLVGRGARLVLATTATDDGTITAMASAPIAPGDYTLEIPFTNDFGRRAVGLYRLAVGEEWYVFTQFEAVDGRKAFPCWDEPSFKIPYQLTLTVPASDLAITNTPVTAEPAAAGGMKTVVFAETPPLPSYLIAIAVGPFETVPISGLSVPGRVVTTRGNAGLTGTAAAVTPPLLAACERYFGRRYPFAKLDLIAVPEYWPGAMENPGAITFAEQALLLDPAAVTFEQRKTVVTYMAHELAHMWFGDLVTMAWWDDLWLNESFASWMGGKVTDEVFPELRDAADRVQNVQQAMALDALVTTRAMRRPIEDLPNLLQSADALAYDKGECLLAMFEQWVGPDVFRRGILRYLDAHAWGNAAALDLWAALAAEAGTDLGAAMSTYLDQPGVPLVRVEPAAGGRVTLRQERFLNHGVANPDPAAWWRIPVVMRYRAGGTTFTQKVLLAAREQTVALQTGAPLEWILPNSGAAGYYRWQLPPALLETLAAQSGAWLDLRERIALAGELAALLDAGALRGDEYLDLLGHLAQDPEPEVVQSALRGLDMAKEVFVTADLVEPFAAYVHRTLSPVLARFGMERQPGEAAAVSLVRPDLLGWLGDEGRDGRVLAYADSLAAVYLADPPAVDPAVAGTALCLAATRGDHDLFAAYRQRFESARLPADRGRFLRGIGSFRDPALADSALAYSLAGPLRPQEIAIIPMTVASHPPFADLNYDFMERNYAAITRRFPPEFAAMMPYAAGGCSTERLARARVFFAGPAHSVPGTAVTLARVAESVTSCAEMRAREGDRVRDYLNAHATAR